MRFRDLASPPLFFFFFLLFFFCLLFLRLGGWVFGVGFREGLWGSGYACEEGGWSVTVGVYASRVWVASRGFLGRSALAQPSGWDCSVREIILLQMLCARAVPDIVMVWVRAYLSSEEGALRRSRAGTLSSHSRPARRIYIQPYSLSFSKSRKDCDKRCQMKFFGTSWTLFSLRKSSLA